MRVSFRDRQAEIQKRMAKQRNLERKTPPVFQIDPEAIEDAVVVEPVAIEDKTENPE